MGRTSHPRLVRKGPVVTIYGQQRASGLKHLTSTSIQNMWLRYSIQAFQVQEYHKTNYSCKSGEVKIGTCSYLDMAIEVHLLKNFKSTNRNIHNQPKTMSQINTQLCKMLKYQKTQHQCRFLKFRLVEGMI